MNAVDITAIRSSGGSSGGADNSTAAASLRYLVTSGFWSHVTHNLSLPSHVASALSSSSSSSSFSPPLTPIHALPPFAPPPTPPCIVHLSAIDDSPPSPPFARIDQQQGLLGSRLSTARQWSKLVSAAASAASACSHRSAAVYFPASAHAVARAGVQQLLLRRCGPAFGDVQEAVAFGRGACAQWGCSWGLQLDTSAWGGQEGQLPANFIGRHLWMAHSAGVHVMRVQDVNDLSASSRSQLQQYGSYMARLQLRDVPDATCALLLPFDHYAEAAGSSNSLWHAQPPSSVISSIMEMFFPGVGASAQWPHAWGGLGGARPMADTTWGAVLDVLVGEEEQHVRTDAWSKYKVVIVPSFPSQPQQLLLDDIVTAAAAGATVVLDAGGHTPPHPYPTSALEAATGCDFGGFAADVIVRAWVGKGSGRAASAATNEVLRVRPCRIPASGGGRVDVLARSVGGAGTGAELPLLVRKWHGTRGGSVITCTVPYLQSPLGLAGPCAEAVALAGAAAAVVSVRSGEEGLLLAYSSSRSSDGSRRSIALVNNAVAWWAGTVRVAAVEQGRPWLQCVQVVSSSAEVQQGQQNFQAGEQLEFETGVEGEACVLHVRVPPLAAVVVSCAHAPHAP